MNRDREFLQGAGGASGAGSAPATTRRTFVTGLVGAACWAGASPGYAADQVSGAGGDTVVELRQYTLRKGGRDVLVDMFEKSFLDPQNALGAHVIGTFRDLDDPDRFVWLRGFHDMAIRQKSLEAFYGGPEWKALRNAANATIVDSDNVLMLRPAGDGLGLGSGSSSQATHVIGARIHYLDKADPAQFAAVFASSVLPRLTQLGAHCIGQFFTESAANNFRLPIREHDPVFVWFARWNAIEDEERFARGWSQLSGWRDDIPEALLPAFMRKPERLRLAPTARSELR
jgi:hypothetical protein